MKILSCKYCNTHGKHLKSIQDTCILHLLEGKNGFIKVELETGGDKPATIRTTSAIDEKFSRTEFKIKFCPMCGQDLSEYISNKI